LHERTMTLSLALKTTATALAQMSNVLMQMSDTPAAVPAPAPAAIPQELYSRFTPKDSKALEYDRSVKWSEKMKRRTLDMWKQVLPNGKHVFSMVEIAEELNLPVALVKFYCGPVFKRGRNPVPEKTRQTIVNLRAAGLTYARIGKSTGVSIATARTYSYHVGKRIEIMNPQDDATIARLLFKVAKTSPELV